LEELRKAKAESSIQIPPWEKENAAEKQTTAAFPFWTGSYRLKAQSRHCEGELSF
jgi:hypothetical protein